MSIPSNIQPQRLNLFLLEARHSLTLCNKGCHLLSQTGDRTVDAKPSFHHRLWQHDNRLPSHRREELQVEQLNWEKITKD